MPLVRIRDVKRGYSETFYTGDFPTEYIIRGGDLLIGMDGEFNISRWKSRDALLNQRVCKITAKSGISEEYLRFALSGALKEIEQRTAFVTVKHLSAKELNKLVLDVPNYTEQERIASTLATIEKIINHRMFEISTLDDLIKARFVEMFGDPKINRNGYPVKLLDSLVTEIIAGWSANGESRPKEGNEKAVLKVSAVTQGYFRPEEHKALPVETEIKKYVYPHRGDLLFSRANTRELVGATAIIEQDYPDLILPDKLWRVLFSDELNVYYAKYVLSTKSIRGEFSSQSTGTSGSMFNVSADKFRNISIPVPPISEQKCFERFIHQVDKSKFVVQKALDEAQTLFDSLMQQYFG